MKRVAVAAALAALASVVLPASVGGAQAVPAESGNLTITHAATSSYPGDPNSLVVCVDGADPDAMDVGDQYQVEAAPGPVEVTVFFSDAAQCSDTPDLSSSVTLVDGVTLGLVISPDALTTFTYDFDCVVTGAARLLLASGAVPAVDVYGTIDGADLTPLALGLQSGDTTLIPDLPTGTYQVFVYAAGAPTDGPSLALLNGQDFAEGTSTQLFLAGGDDNVGLGGFSFQQGPEVCASEEESTTTAPSSTSTTTSQATTSTTAVPATAAPATPVSGASTYTG